MATIDKRPPLPKFKSYKPLSPGQYQCSYETKQVMEGNTSDPGCQAPDLYDPRSCKGHKGQDKECNVSNVAGNGGEKSTKQPN